MAEEADRLQVYEVTVSLGHDGLLLKDLKLVNCR